MMAFRPNSRWKRALLVAFLGREFVARVTAEEPRSYDGRVTAWSVLEVAATRPHYTRARCGPVPDTAVVRARVHALIVRVRAETCTIVGIGWDGD